MRHQGRTTTETGTEERVFVDLEATRDEVEVIAIAASAYRGTFGQIEALRLLLLDMAGEALASFRIDNATRETALLLGEIYRHAGDWKMRAVGQGWESGLAGLISEFGVTVDTDEAEGSDERSETVAADAVDAALVTTAGPVTDPALGAAAEADTSIDEELVDVAPLDSGGALATVTHLSTAVVPRRDSVEETRASPADATLLAPRRGGGVKTRKTSSKVVTAPAIQLAGGEGWQPARVFSIYGVGAAEEQEKRASSALLSVMMGIRPFGRSLASRFGAPSGTVETYLEVPFQLGESTVVPDGVIRVARAGRVWTGMLETKTGSGQLRRDQIERYLDVAREQGFDAVITLSNEIAPAAGEHPVVVDKRKLRKVALHHVSWAEILHEAKMTLSHRGVGDALQAWMLFELIRYLEHPRSGASGFEDMGAGWVPVREAVAAGTLRGTDRKVSAVADAWTRLVRHLCLRLSAELGVQVAHVLPRKLASDPASRIQAVVHQLVTEGTLEATLRVPGAVGPMRASADLRTGQVRVDVHVGAPQEGTANRRVVWLLRQLKSSPDDLVIEVLFDGRVESTCERLRDVRDNPAQLLAGRTAEVVAFRVTRTTVMGTKRSGVRGAFVPSITGAVETCYAEVVQPLRSWVPAAPKMPTEFVAAAEATERAASDTEAEAVPVDLPETG